MTERYPGEPLTEPVIEKARTNTKIAIFRVTQAPADKRGKRGVHG